MIDIIEFANHKAIKKSVCKAHKVCLNSRVMNIVPGDVEGLIKADRQLEVKIDSEISDSQ